jgi:PKD repeat protein
MNFKKHLFFPLLLIVAFKLQAQVEPLIKDNWLTGKPYNSIFPIDPSTGQSYQVGCIEISMSRVLHYYQWPKIGKGADFYRRESILFDVVMSDVQYNWNDMPDELPMNAPLEESKDVSLLIYHVLVASRHAINGGNIDGVKNALVNNFGMKNTLQQVNRNDYSREQWINIAKNELDNGRPIIVQGVTIDSPLPNGNIKGHQFLCDGYNVQGKFHIRWGWGNPLDGYYDIDSLGEYPKDNLFIIGLEPDSAATDNELKAYFLADQASGAVPYTAQFYSKAINIATDATYLWNFGDGTTSAEQNPQHTYTSIGSYTVSLQVTSNGNNDTQTKTDYIQTTETYSNNKTDSLALVALYQQNGGNNWLSHNNWLEGPLDTWENVTIEKGRVVALNLYSYSGKFGLTGDLTPEIAKLTALKSLRLSDNELTGNLPANIGDMEALESLVLFDNQLSGPIPQSIGNLKHLTKLWIMDNALSGSIPSTFGNMTDLQEIFLNGNQLSGEVPSSVSNLNNLEMLDLRDNNLSGKFPSLGSSHTLQVFAITNNQFTGLADISSNFGNPITLWVENNYLDFADLSPYLDMTFSNDYLYSPQNTLSDTTIYLNRGDQFNIESKTAGTQTYYQWYKDGNSYDCTSKTLNIENVNSSDAGVYYCQAGNNLFSNFNINSRNFKLIVDNPNGVSTIPDNIVKVFPNPSNGEFFIQSQGNIQEIKIYSIDGKEMHFDQHKVDNTISIKLNIPGIYILQNIIKTGATINKKITIN